MFQISDPTSTLTGDKFGSPGSLSKFGDPFMAPSWSIMPDNIRSLLDICRFLYLRSPEYAQVGRRVVSYFLTDVEFIGTKSGDKREQEEMRDWLREGIGLWNHQMELGLDENCYGNAFGRIHRPFNRFLLIPTDNGTAEISVSQFPDAQYNWTDVTYTINDPTRSHHSPRSRRKIKVDFIDRVARDINRISLRRIDPAYVYIQHADRSGRYQIVERFQPFFEAAIKRGDLWQVNETPIPQLEAISKSGDFLYNEGEVFHLKAPCISGISNGGWGLPSILANYPNLHQISVYRRIDEAIGLDFMLPFRIFFPQMTGSGGSIDAHANVASMGIWKEMLQKMVRDRRQDPTTIHSQPFPVGFQEVGASGKTLTPKENIDWQTNAMLNAAGYPANLYNGDMTVQQIPSSLRLFENNWQYLPWNFNRHLQWVVRTMLDFMGRERMSVKSTVPRFIDSIENNNVLLQLAAGGEFPRALAYKAFGVRDPVEAAAQRVQEDVDIATRTEKIKRDAAQAANGSLAGDPSQGGAGGAPSGVGYTPMQQAERAQQEAQRLLQIPQDGDRQKELRALQSQDDALYALVKQKMEEMRNAARSQGGQQVAQLAAA